MYGRNDYNTPVTIEALGNAVSLGGGAVERTYSMIARAFANIVPASASWTLRHEADAVGMVTHTVEMRLPVEDDKRQRVKLLPGMRLVESNLYGVRYFLVVAVHDDFNRGERAILQCREVQG